jgi:flagellar biosynthesis/type III secretory pathway M-ring protein FliF/YscJ
VLSEGEDIMDNLIEEALEEEESKIVSIKSESLEQFEKFVERDAESVAQLLRNWLTDDYK